MGEESHTILTLNIFFFGKDKRASFPNEVAFFSNINITVSTGISVYCFTSAHGSRYKYLAAFHSKLRRTNRFTLTIYYSITNYESILFTSISTTLNLVRTFDC